MTSDNNSNTANNNANTAPPPLNAQPLHKLLKDIENYDSDDEDAEEPSFDDLMEVLQPLMASRIGAEESAVLVSYYEAQEFEASGIREDFDVQSVNDVQSLSEMDDWDEAQKAHIYKEMRLLLNIQRLHIRRVIRRDLRQLDWNTGTQGELEQTRDWINKHIYNQFETADDTILRLVFVGIRARIPNWISLIMDSYMKYYLDQLRVRLTNDGVFNGIKVEMGTFCELSPLLTSLYNQPNILSDTADTIFGFANRCTPRLTLARASWLIDDDVTQYIEYIVMVQSILMEKVEWDALHPNTERDNSENQRIQDSKWSYSNAKLTLNHVGDDTSASDLFPFQIDVVILPRGGREISMGMGEMNDTSSDEEDEDSDDDHRYTRAFKARRWEKFKTKYENSSGPDAQKYNVRVPKGTFFPLSQKMSWVFWKHNKETESEAEADLFRWLEPFPINCADSGKQTLKQKLTAFRPQLKSKRIVIVIDRRGPNPEAAKKKRRNKRRKERKQRKKNRRNKNKNNNNNNNGHHNDNDNGHENVGDDEDAPIIDQCMIYEAPERLGKVYDGCGFGRYTCATSSYLVPEHKPSIEPRFAGAKYDSSGKLFVVSFQCAKPDSIRMHWWLNGGGMRFFPSYMLNVWPQMFLNMDLNLKETYTDQWFEEHWTMDLHSPWFDCVYSQITQNRDFHPSQVSGKVANPTKFQLY